MLTQFQISNLARPILDKLSDIEKFYQDEQNEKAYREWYKQKYGKDCPEVKK